MLTREENDLLCRVEGDAAMGKMMRRYWLPAIPSSELVADGAPKRVRLLGEDFVAFRDTNGRVGLLDENCPHRGASLVLARNEQCGLRCLYHGWKFDVEGRTLETPPEPDELNFKDKVRAPAYPVREAGGLVWAYLGPRGSEPPPPDFEFTHFPESHVLVMSAITSCNWAQALEGVIDSSHTNYLHSNGVRPAVTDRAVTIYKADASLDRPSNDGAPRVEAQNTAYGFRYAAIRKPLLDADKNRYIRVTLFAAPCYAIFPAPDGWSFLQAFVPVDDTHTRFVFVMVKRNEPFTDEQRVTHAKRSGLLPGHDLDEFSRPIRHRDNNWLQDREAMKAGSFSGITGINTEDIAVQESMGPIYDRSKEHLGTGDVAVIRMRRVMLDSLRAFIADGSAPLGLAEPVPYARLRAEEAMIPIDAPWQTVGAFAGEPVTAD
jgi:phthalate 4,5-dioxygenase oxygenase subunit